SYGTMARLTTKTVNLTAPTTAPANCGSIYNTATVTDALDTSPGDNSAGPVEIKVACPDVSVNVTAASATINAGDQAVYNVQVKANGSYAADNVVLTDVLPAGLSWAVGGPNASACSTSSGTVTCSFGTLDAGATRSITLTAPTTTANCATFKDSATVSASGDT